MRLTPAVALSIEPAVAPAGNDAATLIGITAHAHAQTPTQAIDLLNDLRRIVRPDGRAWFAPLVTNGGAFDPNGVIGVPSTFVGVDADLWRFIGISVRADLQIVRFGPGDQASAEGEAVARLDLTASVVPEIAPAIKTAFTLYITDSGGTIGSVTLVDDMLALSFSVPAPIQNDIFDLTAAAFDTVGELRAAIAALGTWVVGDTDATLDARASVDLFDINANYAVGAGNKASLTLWP